MVLSIATKPRQTPIITQWAAVVQDENIISFGSIHPDYMDWESELQKLHEAGIKGIKFHPDYRGMMLPNDVLEMILGIVEI